MTQTADHLLPDSPVERTLVARGWADIDLVERLGPARTRRFRSATLGADVDRAREWFRSPEPGTIPPGIVQMYESEANVTRYRRVLDFIGAGERVFEVGIGHGFLATMMLRDGGIERYRGVDLSRYSVRKTTQTLEANGFADVAEVAEQDLYTVTRQDLEAVDATLLVCCEVIEHVPEPEEALATLARALPEGTDLLFSIPLVGRLEGVWGHTQVFGAARIHDMLAPAGLVAHHVEVLHDTWAVVLASTSTAPSPRAARVLEATAPVEPERFLEPPFRSMANVVVKDLERVEAQWVKRVADPTVEPCPGTGDDPGLPLRGLRVRAGNESPTRGPGKGWAAYAGVAFAVPEGTKGARLEVHLEDPEAVRALRVVWSREGEAVGKWVWRPGEARPRMDSPTFLIAPGRGGTYLRRVPGSRVEGADAVEVFVEAEGTADIDFRVLRWAWVS